MSDTLDWPDNMGRAEAAQYLRKQHGMRCSVSALAYWAWDSKGPLYRKQGGGRTIYRRADLDAFADETLGKPIRGPSESREAAA